MAYKNDDDFWNQKSDDDFWNKPVMSDEWLNDTKTETKAEEPEAEKNETEEVETENPYMYKTDAVLNRKAAEKKLSAQTIIRLVFVSVTFLSIIFWFVSMQIYKMHMNQTISIINYTEETVDNSFVKEDGGTIVMPTEAYTLIAADSQLGMPTGEKLIAVPMKHVAAQDARYRNDERTRTYIGYMKDEKETFKMPLQSDKVFPLINHMGFKKEQMLNYYSVASYSDSKGFYFFCVPQEVNELTFFVEQQKGEDIFLVSSVHKKDLLILSEEQADIEALSKEEN